MLRVVRVKVGWFGQASKQAGGTPFRVHNTNINSSLHFDNHLYY